MHIVPIKYLSTGISTFSVGRVHDLVPILPAKNTLTEILRNAPKRTA